MSSTPITVGLVVTRGTSGPADPEGMLVIDLTDNSMTDSSDSLLARSWPGPERLELRKRTPTRKLSESMTPQDWVLVANSVRELVTDEGSTSIVILHGTDTLAYTAAALAYLLSDVRATIVITGSNKPAKDISSDAQNNAHGAMLASRAMPHGVYVSFSGTAHGPSDVFIGTNIRKVRPEDRAFEAPNFEPVARVIDNDVEIYWDLSRPVLSTKRMDVSNDVGLFHMHPGIDLEMIANAVISSNKRGVIICLYQCATGSENDGKDSVPTFVKRCTEAGILVIACVERYASKTTVYPSLPAIVDAGATFAYDMTPEAALAKLSWVLGQHDMREEAKKLFLTPIAGESTHLEYLTCAPARIRLSTSDSTGVDSSIKG